MDINLGEGEIGIDCVRKLKVDHPKILFMMCTVYEDDEKIFEALKAGASGYILKKTTPQKLIEAIQELRDGGAPMSSQIARKVVAALRAGKGQAAKPQQLFMVHWNYYRTARKKFLSTSQKDYYIKR